MPYKLWPCIHKSSDQTHARCGVSGRWCNRPALVIKLVSECWQPISLEGGGSSPSLPGWVQCPMRCRELAPLLAAPEVPVRCEGQRQCGLGEQLPWELGTAGRGHSQEVKAWGVNKTSLVAQTVKRLPTMPETQVQPLGRGDLPEKEMTTHSSILAWKIPWTVEPGRLQSMESQRVGHNWATSLSL